MWLYNSAHERIEFLPYFKDRNIVSVLSTGDKTLTFFYPNEKSKNIIEEAYIRTKKDEYVIKQTKTSGDYLEVTATLNVEELEGKTFEDYKTTYATITETLNKMLEGTGWSVGYCEVTKKRTVTGQLKNVWELSQSCIDTYLCELEYDTINKKINVYEKRGSYKGVFVIDGINMKDLEIQSSSYDFYTRLIPIGKDGLTIESVNNGKKYIDNFQYSKKVKTTYWKDERYTDAESLLEDSKIKLDEISQPVKSYSMNIKDLAKMNSKYKAYEVELGDTILLISKEKNIKLKHRIVKYTEYPENNDNNKIEVSTTKITLEMIQKKFNETTDTVNNVVSTEGTISSSAIDNVNGSGIVDGSISYSKLDDKLKEKIDAIDTDSILKNKKLLLIGDDFIAGGNIAKTSTWPQLIATKNKMTIYNHGVNGATITHSEDIENTNIVDNIDSILSEVNSVDYIIFCAGHYDSDALLSVGENTDNINTTFKGALNTIFTSIINKFPTANFLVLSPFNRTNNEEIYVNAIKEIAGIYSIPFYDNYHDLGINMTIVSQKNIYDSNNTLFLNEKGHIKVSTRYENLLKNL